MRSLLIAFAFACILSSCESNKKTDENMVGAQSSVPTKNNYLPDSPRGLELKPGNKRVTVVENHNADGSSTTTTTTTTTTEPNHNKKISPNNSVVATASTVSSPAVAGSVPLSTKTSKKTGWSSRAKGAVIGGVGGAAAGALIDKNKAAGAVIGGVAGAAGGYIIGNEVDRKKAKQ
jgi:hypothetical protein